MKSLTVAFARAPSPGEKKLSQSVSRKAVPFRKRPAASWAGASALAVISEADNRRNNTVKQRDCRIIFTHHIYLD
jgi:glycerol-3-phosphate O-acyltransferase